MSMYATAATSEQLGTGTRLMLLLLIDRSKSMEGDPIRDLAAALGRWLDELRAHEMADRLDVAMIGFGDGRATVLNLTGGSGEAADEQAFVPVAGARVPVLTASGNTPLGQAITRTLDLLPARKRYLRDALRLNYYCPLVWVLTDGQPNDAWRPAVARLRQAEEAKQALVFAVGFGKADREVLAELAPDAHFMATEARFDAILRVASGSAGALARGAAPEEIKRQARQGLEDLEDIEAWLRQSEVR